jgi:hypothetical protein
MSITELSESAEIKIKSPFLENKENPYESKEIKSV